MIKSVHYERFYLCVDNDTEERIQSKNGAYSWEKKTRVNNLSRETERRDIDAEEFGRLKEFAIAPRIIRDSYKLSDNESIKIYRGQYEGLSRFEIEFPDMASAEAYLPPKWVGKEITHSDIGRDSRLLGIDRNEFQRLIHSQSSVTNQDDALSDN